MKVLAALAVFCILFGWFVRLIKSKRENPAGPSREITDANFGPDYRIEPYRRPGK